MTAAGTAGMLLGAGPVAAQSWRTVSAMRQAGDSGVTPLHVEVEYAAGRVRLAPADRATLYDVHLRYDEERFDPVREFDSATRTLRVGVHQRARNVVLEGKRRDLGELTLALSPASPLDLDLELGATESELDLSGLAVQRLVVKSGASDAKLRFDAPNAVAMRELSIEAGAAGVDVTRLANARAEEVRVKCGVGGVDLDMSGQWTNDMNLRLDVALGGTTLRVPRDVGLRVRVDRVLASFDHEGLVKRGDAWYSPNWDGAAHKLTVDANTVFGSLEVRRSAP